MPAWFNHEALVRARTELGLTQEEVSRMVGVDVRTYRRYESGEVNVGGIFWIRRGDRRRLLNKFCKELGIAEGELVHERCNGAGAARNGSDTEARPTPGPARSPVSARVFLSYSDDSESHRAAVTSLGRLLGSWGAEVAADTEMPTPPRGWAQWSISQFAEADYILIVCTPAYRRRVEEREVPRPGRGGTWEAALLSDLVYEGGNAFGRIGVVLLDGTTIDAIPTRFRAAPCYRIPDGADALRAWLGQPPRQRRLLERVRSSDVDVENELPVYTILEERELSAYLHDLEVLREFDPGDKRSDAALELDAHIHGVRRKLRSGPPLYPGQTLDGGTYTLVRRLGTGGFGTVWLAKDSKVKRMVAIKVLKSEHNDERTRRARFFRGARVMATMAHPNIVKVFDAGRVEAGHHYFVMEYVEGMDLETWARAQKRPLLSVLAIIRQTASALLAAHQLGVLHRDVKPGNILVGTDGAPKLTDFDLAHAPDTEGGTQAEPMGSYLYSSPEVLTDPRAADPRADIYSLGMTLLFCLLDGALPVASKHEVPKVLENAKLLPALKALVSRAASADPATRPETMQAFADDIVAIEEAQEPQPLELVEPPPPYPMLRSLNAEGRRFPMVGSSLMVGRSPRNDLQLNKVHVSSQHAVILWTGELWMIRDLGSRNGTFIDQQRISFEHCRLREGSVVAFGDKLEAWTVISAQPPPAISALDVASGDVALATDGLLTLSAADQEADIFLGASGWICEREHDVLPVVDGDIIDLGARRWTVRINEYTERPATTGLMPSELSELLLADIELVIQVSRDEEFVQVAARARGRTTDLGARAHNYLLLELARQRLVDAQGGLPESECGWVAISDLGEGARVNIDVFRIRRQFISIGVKDGGAIIERRTGERAIRIGTGRLSVVAQ